MSDDTLDVVVFGSCIVDFISYVPRIPNVGETIHGTRFETGFGGKGANQAVAAARLGSRTAIIAKLGDDTWGKDYLENLKRENVVTNNVEIIADAKTGVAQINVAYNGDNQIVIVVGANNHLSAKDVVNSQSVLDQSKVLLCQLETPIPATIAALKTFKGISILNAAPGIANIPKELLTLPDIFCVNETEAALVTDKPVRNYHEIRDAMETLLAFGCRNVILTLGDKGAVFASKDDPRPVLIKAPHLDLVVDTTGAGDAFLGALAHFSARFPDIPLHKKIGAACEIASFSVQFAGTQKSFPKDSDLNLENLRMRDYEWSYLV